MLWIYKRGSESLRVEARFDTDTQEYVLIFYRDDGTQQTERFEDTIAFQNRLETVEKQLDRERWSSDGARLRSDGWKI